MGNNQSKPMVAENQHLDYPWLRRPIYMFQGDGPMVDFTVAANLVGDETFKTKDISAALPRGIDSKFNAKKNLMKLKNLEKIARVLPTDEKEEKYWKFLNDM